jgi:hypothetical protein
MSTLKADTIQSTSGGAATLTKQSAAKAWSNYNHNGGSVNDSFNQSSATDNSTGSFDINFTSSMSNQYYCVTAMGPYARIVVTHRTNNNYSTEGNTTSAFKGASGYGDTSLYNDYDGRPTTVDINGDLA